VSNTPTPKSIGSVRRGGHKDDLVTSGDDRDRERGRACGDDGPRRALVGARVQPDDERSEAERRDHGERGSGGHASPARGPLTRERDDPGEDEPDAEPLDGRRHDSLRRVDGERDDRRRSGDRGHDAHRADGQAAVERGQPDEPCDPGRRGGQQLDDPGKGLSGDDDPAEHTREPDCLRHDEDGEDCEPAGGEPAEEVPDAPAGGAAEGEQRCRHLG
jgi:hypothetical protein